MSLGTRGKPAFRNRAKGYLWFLRFTLRSALRNASRFAWEWADFIAILAMTLTAIGLLWRWREMVNGFSADFYVTVFTAIGAMLGGILAITFSLTF